MKSISKIQILFFFIISIFSCSEAEKTNTTTKIAKDDLKVTTSAKIGLMEERYHLFTYASNEELERKLPEAIVAISNASKYEFRTTEEDIARIATYIEIKDGEALLTEWRYYNSENKLTDRFVYNPETALYPSVSIAGIPPDENGGCPPGTTYLGACNYTQSFASCVAGYSVPYVLTCLTNNKTATVTVTNDYTFARICGSSK